MLNSSIVISPLVLFSGKVNKAVRRTYHIFLPIQVPPRSGTLCDFSENSLHRLFVVKTIYLTRSPFSTAFRVILLHHLYMIAFVTAASVKRCRFFIRNNIILKIVILYRNIYIQQMIKKERGYFFFGKLHSNNQSEDYL